MSAHPVPIERAPSAPARWTESQTELIKQVVAPGCSDEFLAFFGQVCQRRELDPFAGEICAVPRNVKNPDTGRWEKQHAIQVTVDGLRSIAERSGLYGGQDQPQWCGEDGVWRDVWLGQGPPAAARVAVYRLDWARPVVGVARYASYVQLGKDDQGHARPKALWASGPDFMLAKCAEAQALKRAFPRQLAQAGIAVREDLSLAQRVAMEARQLGLGDEDRHAMVAEVTDGRTDSSREMTDGEALAMRARLAAQREEAEAMAPPHPDGPPPGVDPETGEVVDPPQDHAAPGGANPEGRKAASPSATKPVDNAGTSGTGRPHPEQRASEAWAHKEDLDKAMPSLKALEGDNLREFRALLGGRGIPQEALRWTAGNLTEVTRWLEARRLWRGPAPASDFSEEPF